MILYFLEWNQIILQQAQKLSFNRVKDILSNLLDLKIETGKSGLKQHKQLREKAINNSIAEERPCSTPVYIRMYFYTVIFHNLWFS
jgi:hypothetical protein